MTKIILIFIFSVSSFANFSGKWSAKGFFESDRKEGECKEVFMYFKQTPKKLIILDGGYICGDIQASYPTSIFDIVGSSLLYSGEVVGTIDEESLEIEYEDGLFNLKLLKTPQHIIFSETWREGDNFLMISSKLEAYLE